MCTPALTPMTMCVPVPTESREGLDPLELGLLVVSYSIGVLGNALGSSGLPSQDALIKSINVFTFLFWYAFFFYRNLILSRPASDFCIGEDDFEFLTLLPPPATSGLSVYLGGHSISVHTCHTCQSTSCFKWLSCIP